MLYNTLLLLLLLLLLLIIIIIIQYNLSTHPRCTEAASHGRAQPQGSKVAAASIGKPTPSSPVRSTRTLHGATTTTRVPALTAWPGTPPPPELRVHAHLLSGLQRKGSWYYYYFFFNINIVLAKGQQKYILKIRLSPDLVKTPVG